MEDWPVDSRIRDPPQVVTKRQGPRKVLPEPSWGTPIIEGGTWSSSRVLLEGYANSSRLSWVNINSPVPRISTGNTRCIFPPTRYTSLISDGLSFERRVLSMNAWLRSQKGVDDLEAIFLREVLEDNDDYTRAVLEYDPYRSDLLAIDFLTKGHRKRAGIIAYPMGQNFDSLGASVLFDEKWGTVFSPGEKPGWKAPAPILQIVKSNGIYKPSTTSYTHAGCLFAVRTLFDITFVCIAPKPGATVVAKQSLISSFGQGDIGGHRPFDLVFNLHERTHAGLVVSDIGAIWSFELNRKPSLLYSQSDDTTTRVGAYNIPYWGLRWGTHPETLLLGSSSMLSLYDKRTSKVASVLRIGAETMTSFDVLQNESFTQMFVSGTEHVTLVDERMMDRPVVSWAHHRDNDLTLRVKALELDQKKVGLLTSKRSSFISVYDPLLSESGGLEGCDLYGLEWDSPNNCVSASIEVYIPPTTARPTLFHLANSGAIYRQDLGIGPCEPSAERVIWEHELKNLAEKVELEHEQYNEEDLTKYREVNIRNRYEEIFMNNGLRLSGPSVTDVVDLLPTVFQRANDPIDKPAILHDLLRMISQETTATLPRSLFASTRSLPLPKAESLLKHIPHLQSQSRQGVSWSYDLSRPQAHIWPNLVPAPTADDLIAYSVLEKASGNASKRDKEARQEIALGLALSTVVYSNTPFQPSRPRLPPAPTIRDGEDMLSVAASALTLEGIEPPHVQHIQPCPTQGLVDGKRGAEQRQSLVARLLASEWDPDSSPNDYEFHDPYNQDYDESMPAWKLMAQTKTDKETLQRAKSRFISGRTTIAPARSVPLPSVHLSRNEPPRISNPAVARGIRQVESQPEFAPNQIISGQLGDPPSSQANGSSQMPNTQILPGPFGARPGTSAAPKKKKSRLPGF
ncbi:Vacuolar membrane protease [Rhizoctonia solani]|uniref:Vacuolar membrane protease n=1 Tax=Rhizoctonia solani TaxID=456999 RepID=A0A0K6GEB4_9AGAM|nr:Vacuolar membrane protease [Rhizoctonia solani]